MIRMFITSLSLLVITVGVTFAESPTAVQALIITGDHDHPWQETTPILKEILTAAGHRVDVTENPRTDLTSEKLGAYDVLLLHYKDTATGDAANSETGWTDANRQALASAIRSGTGLVVLGGASLAFANESKKGSDPLRRDQNPNKISSPPKGHTPFRIDPQWSDEFARMIGGGRSPRSELVAKDLEVTVQRDHPITRGMQSFHHGSDQLMLRPSLAPGSDVLVTAFDGREQDEPLVWINHYGRGRVVQNALGHDASAMKGDGFRQLLTGCVEWAGEKAFRMLFDGKTLAGWEGNSRYWSVENGAIVGANPSWQPMPFHDFLCSVEEFEDFELRLEAKVIGQRNSGVTVRSRRQPMHTSQLVVGYEIDMGVFRWGWVYEEGGSRRLLNPEVQTELQPKVQKVLRQGDFNDFVIRCEGNRIRAWINGVPFEYVDTNAKLAQEMRKGTIGFQLHNGPPQVVSFRNIRIKELP